MFQTVNVTMVRQTTHVLNTNVSMAACILKCVLLYFIVLKVHAYINIDDPIRIERIQEQLNMYTFSLAMYLFNLLYN